MTTPAPSTAISAPVPAVVAPPETVFEQDLVQALNIAQQTLPNLLSVVTTLVGVATGKTTVAAGAAPATSKSSGGSSTSVGASASISVITDVGAVANAVGSVATASGKIADAIAAHEKLMNTPEMQGASEDAKWQAFVNQVNQADKGGDTKTEEALQS